MATLISNMVGDTTNGAAAKANRKAKGSATASTARRSNASIIRGVIRRADAGSSRAQQALERYSRNSGAESTYGSRVYGGSDSAFLVRNSRSSMRESALNTPASERSSIEKSIARNERKRG